MEREPGIWRVRVYAGKDPVTGHPRQVERTVHGSRRKAEDVRRQLEKEVSEGEHKGSRGTMSHLFDAWVAHNETVKGRRPLTVEGARSVVRRHLGPAFGTMPVSKLSAFDIDSYYQRQLAAGLSPGTVRLHHKILSAALEQAVRWDWIIKNPALRANPPAAVRSSAKPPDVADVKALIEACDDDVVLGTAIVLGAVTGARRGELCGLRWSDVDWGEQTLRIQRQRYTVGGKDRTGLPKTIGPRTVSLGDGGIAILQRYEEVAVLERGRLLAIEPGEWLLSQDCGHTPIRPGALGRAITAAAQRANVKITTHLLRHFAATQMVGAGVDVRTAAGRLGHSPEVLLRVYSDFMPQKDREAARGLEALVLPTTNVPASRAGTEQEGEQ